MNVDLGRRLSTLLVVGAMVSLMGCAATVSRPAGQGGSTSEASRIAPSPAAAGRIVWSVEATDEVMKQSNWEGLMEEWMTSMPAAAQSVGATAQQVDKRDKAPSDKPATRVVIKVNDFRYVSQGMRYGVGVFTGNAHMDLDVDYSELPSGRSLGSHKYATSSSFIQGVFSAMTPKQVQATSGAIVKEVTGKEPVVK